MSKNWMKSLLILMLCAAVSDAAEEPSLVPTLPEGVPMQTLGGRQFWGDVQFFHDMSIQQNVFTKQYRLLDGEDKRLTSGSFEECLWKLEEIRQEQKLKPMTGKVVILIHGIIRSSRSFDKMKAELTEAGYRVFGFDYPSTQLSITDSAQFLERVISKLDGIEEINFVVHSMGGLIVRSYLQQAETPDPRIERMVMLGVPNLGAGMADQFQKLGLFKVIFGPAGQQLVTDGEGLISSLPIPDFQFGILSGARGNDKGYNPLIPGDDDGTVELAHTRLPGACDFVTVNKLHSFLMNDPKAIEYTIRFLKQGVFREKDPPQPISREPVSAE